MAISVYYVHGKHRFVDGKRRHVEIFTEAMLLQFSCLLQQCMTTSVGSEQRKMIANCIWLTLALLLTVNIVLLSFTLREGC